MSSSPKKERKILKSKAVLLGITGGIAAYKTVELVRRLKDEGASVAVVMTEAAMNFVAPLSLEVASGNKVCSSLFDRPMAHLDLPSSADVMVIAPATANIISKFANGIADDLLSTCLLSFRGKIIIAPSMNWKMYENRFFQDNLRKLVSSGVIQVGPEQGPLACGEEGTGRMSDIPDILDAVRAAVSKKDLFGEKIVVTAGPTREYLDPVRFISNRSSGKMGFALARAARDRGAEVALVCGPCSLRKPAGIEITQVDTSEQMLNAVKEKARGATVLIMAAAVADFTPVRKSETKIEKKGVNLNMELKQTADIISEISAAGTPPFIIGFAAETGSRTERAERKMREKGMDMVVFNDVTEPLSGFDADTNRVVIIDRKEKNSFELMEKDDVAQAILDRYVEIKA